MVSSQQFVYNFLKQNKRNYLRVKDLKIGQPIEVFVFDRNALDLVPENISSYDDLKRLRNIVVYLGGQKIKMHQVSNPGQTWVHDLDYLVTVDPKTRRKVWTSKYVPKNKQTLVGWRGPMVKIKPSIFKKHMYRNKPLNV